MNLYREESSNPKWNAQRNLAGRTHYVDDGTLRWHKARILYAKPVCNGLLFYLVESCAADSENRKRVYRSVIFDLFGNVVSRPDLENSYKSRKTMFKHLFEDLNALNPQGLTLEAIERSKKQYAKEMDELWIKVLDIFAARLTEGKGENNQ